MSCQTRINTILFVFLFFFIYRNPLEWYNTELKVFRYSYRSRPLDLFARIYLCSVGDNFSETGGERGREKVRRKGKKYTRRMLKMKSPWSREYDMTALRDAIYKEHRTTSLHTSTSCVRWQKKQLTFRPEVPNLFKSAPETRARRLPPRIEL